MSQATGCAQNLYVNVKMHMLRENATSNFEVNKADTVKQKQQYLVTMESHNVILNIEEEQTSIAPQQSSSPKSLSFA
jgi:hypothetical protein